MQMSFPRLALCSAAVALGGLLLPGYAAAQGLVTDSPTSGPGGQLLQGAPLPSKKTAPPPALPGARASTPAPATQAPTDLSPNDALFDAINRGDIAAARDALSRGAQLDAKNVLGLTPLELSVDLGRNDISFLLLSMRGGSAPNAQASAAPTPAPGKVAAAPAKPPRPAARAQAKAAEPVVAAAAPQRATLFAHDGGTPVPSAGFLGFDPQRGSP